MKNISIITLFMITSLCCIAQVDTTIVKKQKGFLFLSSYNYRYDYDGEHIRPLGFHDFFYPSDCLDVKCVLDSNRNIIFKNGIRIDFLRGRKAIKANSLSVSCIDTSKCYQYNNFHLVPVIIDYKLFEDYEPYVCGRSSYELQVVKGSRLTFEYLHKALIPTSIKVHEQKRK